MNNIKLIIILIYLFTAAGMPDASARKKKNKQSAKTEEVKDISKYEKLFKDKKHIQAKGLFTMHLAEGTSLYGGSCRYARTTNADGIDGRKNQRSIRILRRSSADASYTSHFRKIGFPHQYL